MLHTLAAYRQKVEVELLEVEVGLLEVEVVLLEEEEVELLVVVELVDEAGLLAVDSSSFHKESKVD